jgi:hypothetical protein
MRVKSYKRIGPLGPAVIEFWLLSIGEPDEVVRVFLPSIMKIEVFSTNLFNFDIKSLIFV